MDDFLQLETRLLERIEARLPDLKGRVFLANGSDEIQQRSAPITAWILPSQTEMTTDRLGRALDCVQRWQIILAVRNVTQGDKRPARAQAGPLISKLLAALSGWHPGSPFGLLRAVTPPPPLFEPGLFFYPLEFETRFAYMAHLPLETE